MRVNDVLKTIPKHTWWSEEFPCVYALLGDALRGWVEQGKYFLPGAPSICILLYKNDFCYEESPTDEKNKVYDHVFQAMHKDTHYLKRRRRASQRVIQHVHRLGKQLVLACHAHAPAKTLWKLYNKLMPLYKDFVRYNVALECVDAFSSETLPRLIEEECGVDHQTALQIAMTMCSPRIVSFFEQEELMIFETASTLSHALGYHPHAHWKELLAHYPDAARIVGKLVKQFYWIGNNYKETRMLNEAYFVARAKEIVREHSFEEIKREIKQYNTKIRRLTNAQRQHISRYRFSPNLLKHFSIISYIAQWIDERKRNMTEVNYYADIFCKEIARRYHIDPWLIKYYTPSEFGRLLTSNQRTSPRLLQRRRTLSAHVIISPKKGWESEEQFFYGQDAQKIFEAIFPRNDQTAIKGHVACAPVESITGTAQIVLDANRQAFTPGNILVTTMTRPEFVPLMRRAKAIITDEGGLTCHAAIVSRELGIPCIIGAKTATKILRDGDNITLDLHSGAIVKT